MTTRRKDEDQQAGAADEAPANAFATTLAQLDKGSTLAELSAALTDLVAACRATGKKGALKYRLVIKPLPNTDGAQVMCVDEVRAEIPTADRRATLFFTTEEGRLTRKDPNQRDWLEEQAEAERRAQEAAAAKAGRDRITREDLAAASGR